MRSTTNRLMGAAAEAAGRVIGLVGRGIPGIAGPLLICYGLWLAWKPLGVIAAGGFLLALDRRVP